MDRLKTLTSALALAAALTAGPAGAATVLNASWTDACGKSTCFNEDGVYRQTFSAGAFTGPVTISQLLMNRGVLGALDAKTFRLSFAINGEEVGTWGAFTMGGIGGDELSFSGQEFVWNPEDGDLVLTLALTPPPKPGGLGSLGGGGIALEDGPLGGQEGPFDLPDEGAGDPGPEFNGSAAPEPGAWALMIGGFGLAGAALRRRRVAITA